MLKPFRRVVTGENEHGRSIIIADGPAPNFGDSPDWPGRGVTVVWGTAVPASNEGNFVAEDVAPPAIIPPANAISYIIMEIPPISDLEKMPPDQRARANAPVGGAFPNSYKLDISQGPHMHATDTVDLCIVLSGEVTFYVDEGEVTLKQFDSIIDRGANHGWVNHGKVPCLVLSTVVDAKTLNRDAYKGSAQ